MKHTDIKAFVRKYNSEFAIRGYSKMRKADLFGGSRSASPKMTGYNRDEMRGGWRGENEEGTGYATLKFTMTHPPHFVSNITFHFGGCRSTVWVCCICQ